MSAVWELLNQPLARRLGWALLNSLWQGALAAALFALLRSTIGRRSANVRYITGCAVLFTLAATMVFTFLYFPPTTFHSTHRGISQSRAANAGVVTSGPENFPSLGFGSNTSGLLTSSLESLERLLPSLVTAWSIGVLILSFRLLQGCWQLRVMRREQLAPLESHWLETLNDLKCRLNISRPVRLLKSGLVEVPTVIGWLSPVILFPASSLIGLTPAQLEAILAHELAHVCRHDYLINVFQLIVETLMFYHPAVWWISRCIREEREHCCDDVVIRVCQDRFAYARALATLEELRASPQLAFAASGGALLKRIRRLVGASGEDRPATAKEICGLALLGVGLVFVLVGAFSLFVPPTYQATARVKIERDSDIINITERPQTSTYNPYFIQTEFEVIQSEVILVGVIQELDLNKEWGRKFANGETLKTPETMELLRKKLVLRPFRSTSLIEICAFSDQPEEAARIANAIASAYRNHRLEQRAQMSQWGIDSLKERFKEQEQDIKEAQKKVDDLREKLQIPDSVVNADGPATLLSAESLRRVEAQRIESKTDLVRQQEMLNALKNLSHDELVQALPTAVQDQILTTLLDQLNLSEQSYVVKNKEFGQEHSEIIKLKSQVQDLKEKIKKRIGGILFALEARVNALKKSLEGLEAEVQSAKTNDIAKAQESRPYYDAKHRLDELMRFRQILNMKIAAEKIDVELPKTTIAEIIERARPALRPVSPNRYRAAACFAFGSLLSLIGIVMVKGAVRAQLAPQAA